MTIFRYKDFNVYKEALNLSKEVRILAKSFPNTEQFGLASQITRATDSIVLNIAEGSNRYSDKDFSRFLNQASSSVSEVASCLDIALVNNYISLKDYDEYSEKFEGIYKQLMAFSAKVRNSPKT